MLNALLQPTQLIGQLSQLQLRIFFEVLQMLGAKIIEKQGSVDQFFQAYKFKKVKLEMEGWVWFHPGSHYCAIITLSNFF
jgi:hypothetical protein